MTIPIAWLIDTNVVSEMMRRQPEPRVAAIAGEGLGIASVTVWEILDGIGRLPHGRRRESLAERFLDLLDDLFENRIVDWTVADARACARIMEDKRRRGEPRTRRGDAEHGRIPHTGVTTVNPWTAVPAEPQ